MDILSGLSITGNYLNSKPDRQKKRRHTKSVRNIKPNGKNIYDSWNVKSHRRNTKRIATDRYKKARKPLKTGIVPNIYNQVISVNKEREARIKKIKERERKKYGIEGFGSFNQPDHDSVFSDDTRSMISGESVATIEDPQGLFRKSLNFNNKKLHEEKLRDTFDPRNPGFLSQFEPMRIDNPKDPVSSNNIENKIGRGSNVRRMQMERKMALDGGFSDFRKGSDMTYNVVSGNDFIHNNMVPWFKRGAGKGYGPDTDMQRKLDDVKQRKMETFTGSLNNLEYRPKTERRPLFNPQVGLTNIYGTPNFTDYMQSRYIPSRERRNELVHQPIRTTPGLNLGYNEVSKQGYHDYFRALPRTVDETRTATNPKISYGNVVIPGKKGDRRAPIPNVAKRKPETYKENDPRDLVKSTSYYRAPSIYGHYDAPSTNRQMTSRAYYPPAKFDSTVHKPESLYERTKISHKENFNHPSPRNVTGIDQEKSTGNVKSYHFKPTMRMAHQHRTWVNPAQGHEQKKQPGFDYGDVPQPTMRDLSQHRTWLNPAQGHEHKKQPGFNYGDVPQPTMRDLSQIRGWVNAAKGHELEKQPAFDYGAGVPDPTCRDLTQNRTWVNAAKGHEMNKQPAFDYNDVPDPTIRNTTEVKSWLNAAKGHEMNKQPAFDYNDVPDPTIRNTTEKRTWVNPSHGHEINKPPAFDYSDVPDPTIRNTTEVRSWLNAAQGHELNKPPAFDYNDVPDPTIRNTTEVKSWLNAARGHEINKPPAFDYNDVPDPTLRNLTEVKSWLNAAQGHEYKKAPAFDYNDVPDPTLRNLTERKTWLTGARGHEFEKSPAFDYNDVPDPTLRNLTERKTWLTGARGHELEKAPAFNYNDVPDPTLRNLTEKKTWLTGARGHGREKAPAFDYNDVPDPTLRNLTEVKSWLNAPHLHGKLKGGYLAEQEGVTAPPTMRQLTQNKAYQGPLGFPEREKPGHIIAHQRTIARPTMRQMTQHKTHNNPIGHAEKQRSRADVSSSLVNVMKDITNKNRAPTTSNYDKGPTHDYTMTEFCEPIQINRDIYPNMEGQRPLQCVPTMHTRFGNVLPQWSWRFDTCVVDNLKTNPFINNIVHKSIDY